MIDLLTQLQNATEGSRELDAEIAVATFYQEPDTHGDSAYVKLPHKHDDCAAGTYWLVSRSGMSLRTAPHYTTNLQDAVSLVPERCQYAVGNMYQPDGHFYAEVSSEDTGQGLGKASTGPLALCQAIIKAHQSKAELPRAKATTSATMRDEARIPEIRRIAEADDGALEGDL